MEYGYQGLDFDVDVTFLTQYIDKRAPVPSVKVASVVQIRSSKRQKTNTTYGTFKGKIKLKTYSREEYNSMSTAQPQQLYELQRPDSLRVRRPQKAVRDNSSNESLFADESPVAMRTYLQMKIIKLITEIIQPLTEREVATNRVIQTLNGQSTQ